jgi:DNA-binding MarR family transcriptional regulator
MATKKTTTPKSLGRQLNFTTGRMSALCQKRLEPHGLSLPQWVILSCLWREGELTVGALSERIGNGLSATSRIIDRMVERDLIDRRRDDSDGRMMHIKPTKRGEELNHLIDFYEEINSVLLHGFTKQEREAVFDLLFRMEQNASKALM